MNETTTTIGNKNSKRNCVQDYLDCLASGELSLSKLKNQSNNKALTPGRRGIMKLAIALWEYKGLKQDIATLKEQLPNNLTELTGDEYE